MASKGPGVILHKSAASLTYRHVPTDPLIRESYFSSYLRVTLEKRFGEMGNIHSTHVDREPSFLAFFCAQLFPYRVSEVQELSPAFPEGYPRSSKKTVKLDRKCLS